MSADLPLLDNRTLAREGVIERVIFHNEENGYTVLKLALDGGHGDSETLVGHLASPKAGTRMRFGGKYEKNPRFGRQFVFQTSEEVMPSTAEDIRLYLSSGLIKGIGNEMARRIVDKFGVDSIRTLDDEPEKLLTVPGIGKKTLEKILQSWSEHRGIRDLMLFLRPHGVSAAYAVRIFRAYGGDALRIARENPYRLAMDIRGIGFITADSIAAKLGFSKDHPLRIQAATLYLLQKASEDGHVYLPKDLLIARVCKETETGPELAEKAIAGLEADQRLICEQFGPENGNERTGVYLRRFHHCESKTAWYLQRLMRSPKSVNFRNVKQAVANALSRLDIELAPSQIKAVDASAAVKVLVVTGGPGTGKTTIINAIIRVFDSAKARILLAAPTGRAAKRMAETSGKDAKTLHRLLEYSPGDDRFSRNEDCPLSCDLLVVDEASMMDGQLFYHLLKAVPLGATLILVGDANQLPSVGPGNVLGDIIKSGVVPVVGLNEIFRQAAESEIILNAHLINRGKMPMLERRSDRLSDFYFFARDDEEDAANFMVDLIKRHIPNRFGLDPVNDIQLITPMYRGAIGAENMNARLQEALNPNGFQIQRGNRSFRVRDKVMQIRNNYDKDIFNGDIGRIVHIDKAERKLFVDFDGVRMPYEFEELDELVPAYAISIHKSQGSEYPAVVIPVMMKHYIMLKRNLIYTAVTRGKKLVALVGENQALQIAINDNKTGARFTRLAQRLAESPEF